MNVISTRATGYSPVILDSRLYKVEETTTINYNCIGIQQIVDSAEETEDASETDGGKSDVFTEIKEQIYLDKLENLKQQLQELYDGDLPDYKKKQKKLDSIYQERLQINEIWKDYLLQTVEKEHILERNAASKEFEEKKVELKETLVADIEEKRKILENEQLMMGINGDHIDPRPLLPRKLRRRPNDPAPLPEKKKKQAPVQIHYILDDKDIDMDLKEINYKGSRNMGKKTTSNEKPIINGLINKKILETKIKDGKLMYEKRWFLRGQPIYVEGKNFTKFPGIISSIGNEVLSVSRINDGGSKFKISLTQLVKGKISIKRRAS